MLLKKYIKNFIHTLLGKFGYQIVAKCKAVDINAYSRFEKESINERLFFNVGAGSFSHPYWTNIDYQSSGYANIQGIFIEHNLMEFGEFSIKSNTAECIYTSHTVEHVTNEAVEVLFREAFRCLKKGGVIRVTTPDVELNYSAYQNKDRSYYYFSDMYSMKGTYEDKFKIPYNQFSFPQLFLHQIAGQLVPNDIRRGGSGVKLPDDKIEEIISSNSLEDACDIFIEMCKFDSSQANNHVNWWSYGKLKKMLADAGFDVIYRSGYGQSRMNILRDTNYFDNTHPAISLYVEAVKV